MGNDLSVRGLLAAWGPPVPLAGQGCAGRPPKAPQRSLAGPDGVDKDSPMGFFAAPLPLTGQPFAQPREPAGPRPPADELPGVVPLELFIFQSDSTVLTLTDAQVYSSGVLFRMHAVTRRRNETEVRWKELRDGRTMRAISGVPEGMNPLPDWLLRCGIETADGRKVTTIDSFRPAPTSFAEAGNMLTLRSVGGSSGDSQWSARHDLWLWQFPPAAPLRLVVEWPAVGIPETSLWLDGEMLAEASLRVQPFWKP